LAADIGAKKKPSDERGPKDISEIRQPKPMISDGVRQLPAAALDCEAV
jgi:hypothetical protein